MRVLHVVEASGSGTLRIVEVLAERQVDAGHTVRVAVGNGLPEIDGPPPATRPPWPQPASP